MKSAQSIPSLILWGRFWPWIFLKIERFYSSPLPLGNGNVSTAHGVLPVPAPATLQLLSLAKAPLVDSPSPGVPAGELVTPTGAALVTSLATFKRPDMVIDKVGYGAGFKDIAAWPNVLRIWLGEEKEIFRRRNFNLARNQYR